MTNDYIQVLFQPVSPEQSEILVAMLSAAGFEGFEEEENRLKAFIPEKELDEQALHTIAIALNVQAEKTVIRQSNWNELWESGFQPVVIDDFVAVRAHFHQPSHTVQHEIIITPKMSFGTGHHATTYMMIRQMREIDFAGKSVLDFGTGTGILAILAAKLGASRIIALDNDEWSIANCRENILQNNALAVEVKKAGSAHSGEQSDIILANINKNVILDNFSLLAMQLAPGGVLVISGLLLTDEREIQEGMKKQGFRLLKKIGRDNWLSMKLTR